jgi:hypothetical protein
VPKLVEVSGFQKVLGMPPVSKPPSTIMSEEQGEAEGATDAVAETDGVGVGTIGVVVVVGVGVGVVTGGVGVVVTPTLAVGVGVGLGAAGVTSPGLIPAQYGPVGPPSGLVVATGT